MKYLLRPLTPEDRPLHEAMSRIIVAHLPRPDFLLPMTPEEYEDTFAAGSPDLVLGLFDNDRLIATSALLHDVRAYQDQTEVHEILTHSCAEIGECMVLPEYRGKSLMLQLNQLLKEEAKRQHIEYMLATAHPENIYSNNSLKQLGFQIIKTFTRQGKIRNLLVMKVE